MPFQSIPVPAHATPFWPSASWPSDRLSLLADFGGFVGLAASVWAAVAASLSNKAVSRLEEKYQRRDLLPAEVNRYQAAFASMATVFNSPPDRYAVSRAVGEFKGRLNALETLLRPGEMGTLKSLRKRIALIEAEPNAPNHLQALVSGAGTFSAELDTIVGKVEWNSQS